MYFCMEVSACERLILLEANPEELRDYAALLYHCSYYEEALHYLKLYNDVKVLHLPICVSFTSLSLPICLMFYFGSSLSFCLIS